MLTYIALAIAIIIALIFMITMAIFVAKYKLLQNKCSPYEDNTEEVDKFLSNKQQYLNAVAGQKECEKSKIDLDLCSRDKSTCVAQTEAYVKERDQNKRDLEACRSGAAVCAKEKEDALRNIQNSSAAIANCMREKTQLTTEKVSVETQLAQCNGDRQTCNTERVAASSTATKNLSDLNACNSSKTTLQNNLNQCTTATATCNTNVASCDASLKACQSQQPVPCLYGPWIGADKCLPAVINKLADGRIVYLTEDEEHTKMVASNGEAKFYVGKISQFDAAKWALYTAAGANYKLRVCKPECTKGCDVAGNCSGVAVAVVPAPAVALKISQTNWQCVPGFDYPVSLNMNGDVQCMSADAKNCIPGGCAKNLASPPALIKPLVCGEPHKAIYGSTGYDNAGHWCNTTKSAIQKRYITLYQHGGFGGYAVNIGPGKYTMVDLQKLGVQNNDVSSLKVSGGAQYILFDGDNFQGISVSGSTDMAGVPAGFNDVLSSIIVS